MIYFQIIVGAGSPIISAADKELINPPQPNKQFQNTLLVICQYFDGLDRPEQSAKIPGQNLRKFRAIEPEKAANSE